MVNKPEWGRLIVCPTPIGNMKDVTLRTLEVLRRVQAIACEDIRMTRKLLSQYDIHKPLINYRPHNRSRVTERMIVSLREGNEIALVTDAGTPGIQDPGGELVRILEEAGISIEVLPGPTALIPAAVLSGFCAYGFVFLGFLPRKRNERLTLLELYASRSLPVILYESPRRVLETLREIASYFGNDREIFLCRELSKFYEEKVRMTVGDLVDELSRREDIKGEIVLVIRGVDNEPSRFLTLPEEELLYRLLESGMRDKEIATLLTGVLPAKKNTIKQFLHSARSVDFTQENCFNKNRPGR
ncbi:MAG TPA: 16S rRNA (cytidine(1402)-2'-O)-methyltransferase [Atribacteraceae bacterium]|nr:16S rRNA (cytidine(1402)-2'-O)-methyltransferase [Atribacteraceae bacterium]